MTNTHHLLRELLEAQKAHDAMPADELLTYDAGARVKRLQQARADAWAHVEMIEAATGGAS
jgi:hypothetical protein